MVFRVKDVGVVIEYVLVNGGKLFCGNLGFMELNILVIYGIGESMFYFVDCYGLDSIYDVDFLFYFDWQECVVKVDVGLQLIDYFIYNVKCGNMVVWVEFYENIGNFCEICYFDIEGKFIGLVSKVMILFCGCICILINELVDDYFQIEEFIKVYNGEGIQYIVLFIDDIYKIVLELKGCGLVFMDILDIYYDVVNICILGYGELIDVLRDLWVLIDGVLEQDGILL